MFYEYKDSDIENYTDDTTPYACASDIITVISELQVTASKLLTWFNNNHVKANPEKSHFLLSSQTPKKAYFGGAFNFNFNQVQLNNCLEFRLILTLLLTTIFLLFSSFYIIYHRAS